MYIIITDIFNIYDKIRSSPSTGAPPEADLTEEAKRLGRTSADARCRVVGRRRWTSHGDESDWILKQRWQNWAQTWYGSNVWKEWITETIDINFKCYCSKIWNNDMDVWIPNLMFKCLDGLEILNNCDVSWIFTHEEWGSHHEFHGYSDIQSFHRWKMMILIMAYVLIYRGWNL